MSAVRFITNLKLQTNCVIYTNVTSFKLFSDTIFIEDIFELMQEVVKKCDECFPERPNIVIFFDEIFTLLTKNDRIQADVLSFISQLRKRNIIFVTTAQEWLEINLTFRRYIRYNINCNLVGLFGKSYFYNQMQDAENMQYDKDLGEYIAPTIETQFGKCEKTIADSYDTFQTIKVTNQKKR